ncbi:unnamed protein product [marine sediment metagenome]|uniref:Uncharacterized protein n=1 Tax=marine sediment metagenome TaxID=412755 RepID=X0YNI1_9ZZZZ
MFDTCLTLGRSGDRLAMIQCKDCEFYRRGPDGSPQLTCDPFSTIREPECLTKWQLIQLNTLAQSHQATLDLYRRFAPLQEKMFRQMEREIDEAEEADRWKQRNDEDEDDDPSGF